MNNITRDSRPEPRACIESLEGRRLFAVTVQYDSVTPGLTITGSTALGDHHEIRVTESAGVINITSYTRGVRTNHQPIARGSLRYIDVFAGPGADYVNMNTSVLTYVHAGGGDDYVIFGSMAKTYLPTKLAYHNRADGGDGNDILQGGAGHRDHLYGGNHDDLLLAGGGDDRCEGGAGADDIYGEGGNDLLYGGSGEDEIYGGTGHDNIYGGSDRDRLFGEDGDDLIESRGDGVVDVVDAGTGIDSVYCDGLVLWNRDSVTGAEYVYRS